MFDLTKIPEWITVMVSGAAGWIGSILTRYLFERNKRKAEDEEAEITNAKKSEEFYHDTLSNREETISVAFKRLAELEQQLMRLSQTEIELRLALITKEEEIKRLRHERDLPDPPHPHPGDPDS